ncbi:glycosyltransferase family 2 protein [Chryseobacterium arthrosphaerae]|uniref:glycosyltransferase family 2 protein n=1 Tax=Chryseobacterium arthrosphaerae TaxID=651561 RepID=UPI001F4A6AD2|nr:glycosyltransferase family 2 protein [Chryseobacterium arthrosphaerae]MDG4654514.1 glycosyltransferase family 2 protein [Chryseobacterium arthrosphaerae]
MKISIVTAYYNRKKLFENTLSSIVSQSPDPSMELEVIAVDDGSDEEERLEDLTEQYPFLKVIRLEKADKWYFNSCIPFNIGFREAKGDIVILQNPECLHYGDVLKYTQKHINDSNYISFSCFSLGIESTDNLHTLLESPEKLQKLMADNNVGYIGDGLDCWYNHSVTNPKGYHFCSAITKKNLYDLGGFDERFARGIAFDDNEFLHRVKLKGLQIEIIDQPIVLHQNHYQKISYTTDKNLLDDETYQKRLKLAEKNRILFELVTKSDKPWRANYFHENEEHKVKRNFIEKIKYKIKKRL